MTSQREPGGVSARTITTDVGPHAYLDNREVAMMQQIHSEALAGIEYDAIRRTLTVQFRRGGHVYRYFHVPASLYQRLLKAQPHPWRRWGKTVMAHRSVRIR